MAKEISSLAIRLGANAAPYVKGLKDATAATQGFAARLKSIGAGAASVLSGVVAFEALKGVTRAVYNNTIGLTKSQLEAIDSNAKLSDRIGTTTEALSGLQHAADLSGVANDALAGGIEKYLKNVGEAVNGNKAAQESFRQLGLEFSELAKMPTDRAIGMIGDALNAIENPAQRAAAAQSIFGKSGQGLLPLLKEGSAGLEAMVREAEALGLTFSRLDAAKVEEANDAFSRVKAAIVGVGRTIAVAISPYLKMVADRFTEFGKRAVASIKSIVPQIISTVIRLVNIVTPYVEMVWTAVSNVFTRIWNFVAPIMESIRQVIETQWRSILQSTIQYGLSIWNLVSSVFNAAWSVVSAVASGIASAWTWTMNLIGVKTEEGSTRTQSAFSTIVSWGNWLRDSLSMIFDTISFGLDNWSKVWGYVGVSVAYEIVKIGNWFAYQFTEVIPAYLEWFSNNFTNIITDAFNIVATRTKNGIGNIAKIIWNLPSLIRGKVTLDELWTPLNDGFKATISELPELAERVPGTLEDALGKDADKLGQELSRGLGERLAGTEQQAKDAANAISKTLNGISDSITAATAPTGSGLIAGIVQAAKQAALIKMPVFDLDTDLAETKIDDIREKIRNIDTGPALLVAGSADAQHLHDRLAASEEQAKEMIAPVAKEAAKSAATETSVAKSSQPDASTELSNEVKSAVSGPKSERSLQEKMLQVSNAMLSELKEIAGRNTVELQLVEV